MRKIIILVVFSFIFGCGISPEKTREKLNECKKLNLFPLTKMTIAHDIFDVICVPFHTAKSMVKPKIYNHYIKSLKKDDIQ